MAQKTESLAESNTIQQHMTTMQHDNLVNIIEQHNSEI